jgi:hypothetical protein
VAEKVGVFRTGFEELESLSSCAEILKMTFPDQSVPRLPTGDRGRSLPTRENAAMFKRRKLFFEVHELLFLRGLELLNKF